MVDIVYIALIITFVASILWRYSRSPGVVELCSKYRDDTNQTIEWTSLGVLINGGKGYGIFWDGLGRVGYSITGIHYKSWFQTQIHIPWSEVIMSTTPKWMGIPYGRRYKISSHQLDVAAIFVSKASGERIIRHAAYKQLNPTRVGR